MAKLLIEDFGVGASDGEAYVRITLRLETTWPPFGALPLVLGVFRVMRLMRFWSFQLAESH